MKLNMEIYKELELQSLTQFSDKVVYIPTLNKLVTFTPNMKLPIHKLFYYKQGFSCELVDHLINRYWPKEKNLSIYDPFCGVGTTPIRAYELGHYGVGTDISPLAIFVAECKRIRITNPKSVMNLAEKLVSKVCSSNTKDDINKLPYYLKKGFQSVHQHQIIDFIREINEIENSDYRKIFLLGLMKAAYDISLTKKDGGFLRYKDAPRFHDIGDRFIFHLNNNLKNLQNSEQIKLDLNTHSKKLFKPHFEIMDARNIEFPSDSFDGIITSPPYLNRYDYTRIYAVELAILGLTDMDVKKLRKKTIKSHVEADFVEASDMKSEIFLRAYQDLKKSKLSNPQIPEMVWGYFNDLTNVLIGAKRTIKNEGKIFLILGNCRFSGIHFEVDAIISEIAKNIGLEIIEIIVTKFRGSSAQQIKSYGDAQLRESIVVLGKCN